MSRIGAKPIVLPSGVIVEMKESAVTVRGPKGELELSLLPEVRVTLEEGNVVHVKRRDDSAAAKARHGLIRMLIANAAMGVSQGYERQLEIIGVGYKAQIKGKTIVFNLGHSHPITMAIPAEIEVTQDEKNKNILKITGIDKQRVGQIAAEIRALRPPEPYKGKGVRYIGEEVRRKPGKAAVTKAVGA